MTTRIQKSLRNLNRIMSDDYQKLSDMYKDLKLSHNRQERLLKRTAELLSYISTTDDMVQEVHYLFLAILNEFNNPLYRCRERRN